MIMARLDSDLLNLIYANLQTGVSAQGANATNTSILGAMASNTRIGYVNKSINQGGTLTILASVAGTLRSTSIGGISSPSLTLYDNASGASGTILLQVDAGGKACYVQDVSYVNGVTALVAAGNAFQINVSLR